MSDVVIFVATGGSLEGRESTIELNNDGHGRYLDDIVFASVDHQRGITGGGAVYVNASRVRGEVVEETFIGVLLATGEEVEGTVEDVTVRFHHLAEGEPI